METKAPTPRTFLLTFTTCKALARAMGFTLRREAPGEESCAVYPVGTGADSGPAYFDDAVGCLAHASATSGFRDSAPQVAAARHALRLHDTIAEAQDMAARPYKPHGGPVDRLKASQAAADFARECRADADRAAREGRDESARRDYMEAACNFTAAGLIRQGILADRKTRAEVRNVIKACIATLEREAASCMEAAERAATRIASRDAAHGPEVPPGHAGLVAGPRCRREGRRTGRPLASGLA